MTPENAQLVESILSAYRQGYFPMADSEGRFGGRLVWLSPDPRGVIPLEGFRVSRSLRRRVRSGRAGGTGRFVVRADTAFEGVIRGCAGPRWYEEGTWIDERIVRAYTLLHEAGHGHCVEVWRGEGEERERASGGEESRRDEEAERRGGSEGEGVVRRGGEVLVGGVYGLAIGGAFFAESMFCRPDLGGTDASKVALVHLVFHLRRRGYTLLDTQFWNEHIDQFGCVEIPRVEYLRRLREAVGMEVRWGVFEPDRTVGELA